MNVLNTGSATLVNSLALPQDISSPQAYIRQSNMNVLNTGSATLVNSLALPQDISSPQAYIRQANITRHSHT